MSVDGNMAAKDAIFPRVDVVVMAMVRHNYEVEQKIEFDTESVRRIERWWSIRHN